MNKTREDKYEKENNGIYGYEYICAFLVVLILVASVFHPYTAYTLQQTHFLS